MFCGKCGTQLSDTDKFCPRCGEKVSPVIIEKEKPSINQEEVQNPENHTSFEQSKPLNDSGETVRPRIVPVQNVSDKQDNANANPQNIEVPGLGSFDRQQFAIIVACFAAAIIIPLIFVKGLGSSLIVGAVVGFGVTFILDQYKINPNNKVFYSIIAVAALAGTVKYANTPTTSKSSGGISSIFSIFKTKEQRIQDVRDLLAKAETVEDFEEVWNAYKSLATEEKLELGVGPFLRDFMIKGRDKLTPEEMAVFDIKTGFLKEIDENMGLY
ncbi:MAG: zinc-ribbon domain-containing protein [Bacteroidaceae bacterium]|nr:zinc-ribbon domain-containing protein [Bacteroidaceae bacterium]